MVLGALEACTRKLGFCMSVGPEMLIALGPWAGMYQLLASLNARACSNRPACIALHVDSNMLMGSE